MRKNLDNILMALFVAVFIIAALGFILQITVMATVALCVLTAVVGFLAGLQVFDFLSADTVGEGADVKRNRILLLQTIVAVVIFLALLAATIFQLCGKLF